MKESDLCNTPTWLKEHFVNHFDPCPENPSFDGLSVDWKNPAFVNPPYSEPLKWVLKAIEVNKMDNFNITFICSQIWLVCYIITNDKITFLFAIAYLIFAASMIIRDMKFR